MRKSNVINSRTAKSNTKSLPTPPPDPLLKGDTVPLHLMTLSRDEESSLNNLNMLYTTYTLSEMGIDDPCEDKEEIARFFLDVATMIRFVYANFSE